MVSRITKLLLIFFIVALAAGIIVLNPAEVTVQLTPGNQFSAMGGVIFLVIFAAGMLLAATFWIFFGVKAYFRERSYQHQESQRQQFYRAILDARSALAVNDLEKAKHSWEKLVKKDPTDVIARVELSRSLEHGGQFREALKVLEAARASDPTNSEVLMRAAELNLGLNNKTAAIDNLALSLYHHPSRKAARLARDLSEDLDRIDDALEYHNKLKELSSNQAELLPDGNRIELKKLIKETEDPEELKKALARFIKKSGDFPPALCELAKLEAASGNTDQAAELLIKAARADNSRAYWFEAVKLWIDNGMSDRAIGAARTAIRNTEGKAKLRAELDLIRLLLDLHQFEEARKNLDSFAKTVDQEFGENLETKIIREYLTLKGLCLNQLGEYKAAAEIWRELTHPKPTLVMRESLHEHPTNGVAPSPVLSTP